MLVCDITGCGADLKSKLCGCWMCFGSSPTRIAARNVLCQRKGRDEIYSYLSIRSSNVDRQSLISPSPFFTTNNILGHFITCILFSLHRKANGPHTWWRGLFYRYQPQQGFAPNQFSFYISKGHTFISHLYSQL